MTLLSIRELSVRYAGAAIPALDGVTLDVVEGERLAVIGESGSGKSTLAQAIAGILPPSASVAGSIAWPGLDRPARAGADVGIVFQDPSSSLDPVMRVGRQVAEVIHVHRGLSWRDAEMASFDLLAQVGLPDPELIASAYPHQLSGGQRQRVAIAAAIAGRPRLLIADEATSALDTIVQAQIAALLDVLTRERGMTLIFITHDIALASQLADRIAVLKDGRLVELDGTETLLRSPRHPYTRSLIEAHLGLDA